jgi:hypothetical protein
LETSGEPPLIPLAKRLRLLTEQQIARSWHKLMSQHHFDDQVAVKAEGLLDQLRPESPLRHRLTAELDELRRKGPQQHA